MKTTLQDSIELRARRIAAYRAGAYRFSVPPVYSGNWNDEAWCNWVQFNDHELTGFIDYSKTAHHQAEGMQP